MQRNLVTLNEVDIPKEFHRYLNHATIFNSSCSQNATVWFLDNGLGYYLKKAPKGSLQREVTMTSYFSSKLLAPEVIAYESLDDDWMLTVRAKGEDCIDPMYTGDPQRLCDTVALLLRMLHETDTLNCPIPKISASVP